MERLGEYAAGGYDSAGCGGSYNVAVCGDDGSKCVRSAGGTVSDGSYEAGDEAGVMSESGTDSALGAAVMTG